MPEDVKPHKLFKQLDGFEATFTVVGIAVTAVDFDDTLSSWEWVSAGTVTPALFCRSYIDLEGWSAEDLTTFTQSVDVQKMRVPLISATIPTCYEYDLLTTRPITDDELSNFQTLPGFLGSSMDQMEVIYAQGRTYATNGNVNTFVTIDTNAWGAGQPTAMSKLHWTRIYIPTVAADASVLQTYSTNLVVNALSAKEKDLVHLERLRRSYVLQDE